MKRQNNIKLRLLATLLTVASLPSFAQEITADGIKYFTAGSDEVQVMDGKDCKGDVIIPESISFEGKKYKVTAISTEAFKSNTELTSVTISDSVTKIYKEAFYGCTNLASVIIGESVTEIGERAFIYCENLTTLNIPDSVTTIEEEAFDGCYKLTSLTLGSSVSYVGGCAFLSSSKIINIICLAQNPPSIGYVPEKYGEYPNVVINSWEANHHPFSDNIEFYCTLYVPDVSVEVYQDTDVWKEFAHIKPLNMNEVDENTEASESFSISGNTLSVDVEVGTFINIFSIDGAVIFNSDNGSVSVELPSGIYILKIGNKTTRFKI